MLKAKTLWIWKLRLNSVAWHKGNSPHPNTSLRFSVQLIWSGNDPRTVTWNSLVQLLFDFSLYSCNSDLNSYACLLRSDIAQHHLAFILRAEIPLVSVGVVCTDCRRCAVSERLNQAHNLQRHQWSFCTVSERKAFSETWISTHRVLI